MTSESGRQIRRTDWPVLFDLQVNGFAGVDFQRPDLDLPSLRRAVMALRRRHIHRILLTLITDRIQSLCHKLERFEAFRATDAVVAETIAGYHLEGPYLSPVSGYCGAHQASLMHRPAVAELDRLWAAAVGRIKLITLAPEWPGTDEFIREARRRNIVIALGHTQAQERDIAQAVAAGATLCTHLGNGVPQRLPRHDNVVQRLLAHDELTACLIPDGIHLPPFVLQNFFRAKPPGKVVLVSDGTAAAAAPPGRYTIGRMVIDASPDGIVRRPGHENFAGSSLTLDRGVANAAAWLHLAPEAAWRLASTAAAGLFGTALPTLSKAPAIG